MAFKYDTDGTEIIMFYMYFFDWGSLFPVDGQSEPPTTNRQQQKK
jgi:hypothetical protein